MILFGSLVDHSLIIYLWTDSSVSRDSSVSGHGVGISLVDHCKGFNEIVHVGPAVRGPVLYHASGSRH